MVPTKIRESCPGGPGVESGQGHRAGRGWNLDRALTRCLPRTA